MDSVDTHNLVVLFNMQEHTPSDPPSNISHITEEEALKRYRRHRNSGHFSSMAPADPAVENWPTTCVFLLNHARHNVSLRCLDTLRKVNGYVLVGKIPIS